MNEVYDPLQIRSVYERNKEKTIGDMIDKSVIEQDLPMIDRLLYLEIYNQIAMEHFMKK